MIRAMTLGLLGAVISFGCVDERTKPSPPSVSNGATTGVSAGGGGSGNAGGSSGTMSGGGGAGGGGDEPANCVCLLSAAETGSACETCIADEEDQGCQTEMLACQGSPGCLAIIDCIEAQACDTKQCFSDCLAQGGTGDQELFHAVKSCSCGACQDDCAQGTCQ